MSENELFWSHDKGDEMVWSDKKFIEQEFGPEFVSPRGAEVIYVSGPISDPDPETRLKNVERAMFLGHQCVLRGHAPHIPHLDHFFDQWLFDQTGQRFSWVDYMKWDLRLLENCDSILYYAPSRGADVELKYAEHLGLKVYRRIDEVPVVVE